MSRSAVRITVHMAVAWVIRLMAKRSAANLRYGVTRVGYTGASLGLTRTRIKSGHEDERRDVNWEIVRSCRSPLTNSGLISWSVERFTFRMNLVNKCSARMSQWCGEEMYVCRIVTSSCWWSNWLRCVIRLLWSYLKYPRWHLCRLHPYRFHLFHSIVGHLFLR